MNKPKPADLTLGDVTNLEDLVDRSSLGEVCRSFFDLFGLSIRVFSRNGALLADVHEQRIVCQYINKIPQGRAACLDTVGSIQKAIPEETTLVHRCFNGAVYHIIPIWYSDRQLGRIVIGPFLPTEVTELTDSLLEIISEDAQEQVSAAMAEMPRVRGETSERIATHFRNLLDLILFAGHRSQLMSDMHLATIRESYKELAERNASLQEAYEQLKALDQLKSDFLATVSHELRTPLTSIIGYSEMLLAGLAGKLTEQQHTFAETINSKGELLMTLITRLLDLGKLERETITLSLRSIDPKEMVSEIVETMLPEARKKGVDLKAACPKELHYLNADPVRLKQILLNIVSNAVKFTETGGLVTISARSVNLAQNRDDFDGIGAAIMAVSERAIEFEIRDTGIGIAKENLDDIFKAFYQVDSGSTREFDGIGLGLSIVKKLVDAHGGTIRVESEVDEGTVFYLVLPERPPDTV